MKNVMTFDEIYLLKDRAVQLVLKEIDVMDLEYALMEASAEVKEAFFRNMSKRAEQMITEDMQYNTNISRKDSLKSQQKILNVIFGLEKSGCLKNKIEFFVREFLCVIYADFAASCLFFAMRSPHRKLSLPKTNLQKFQ